MSCSLIYKNGNLVLAKTRGDGNFGEDITEKILWISMIPKTVESKQWQNFEVRGEIFCTENNLKLISDEMEKIGLDRPSSQRNIVAGLIGRKENIEISRHLSFHGFEFIIEGPERLDTEEEKIAILRQLNFETPDYIKHFNGEGIDKALDGCQEFIKNGEYLIDGVVLVYNEIKIHEELGETAHHPRYKIAFKFRGNSKETLIEEIKWSLSRNGYLTPVASVAPVELSGAIISRVTLHNFGIVSKNNLKKGDLIEIIRSGEVIPKFLKVNKSGGEDFIFPEFCPSCKEKLEIIDIRLICQNKKCMGRSKDAILNFVQKIGIEDISHKRLEEMLNSGLIKNIESIYELTIDQLMTMSKVKEKLAKKIIENIEKSKKVEMTTFLASLGISGGAYNKCEKVVKAGFDTIEEIKALTTESLMTIEGFAETSSESFINSLKEKKSLISNLENLGFTFRKKKFRGKKSKIENKVICITGALSVKRSILEDSIRNAGGLIGGSISKKTDYLLINEKKSASSKFKKAQELDIPMITEEELKAIIGS